MEENDFGFVKNGWFTLTADITLEDQQGDNHQNPESDVEHANAADGPMCIICMDQEQTSGVLHGETYMTISECCYQRIDV